MVFCQIESITQSLESESQYYTQLPWLLMFAIAIPMVLLAWRFKIYPSWLWMVPLLISLVLSVVTIFVPSLLIVTAIVDVLLLITVGVDVLWLYLFTNQGIIVQRSIPKTVSLGVPLFSEISVENRTHMALRGSICDDTPEEFTSQPEEHPMKLPRMGRLTARRKLTPQRRGAFHIENVFVRFSSPMRFWVRQQSLPLENTINVYPDMKQLSDYALLARTNRLSLIGVRQTRRIGQDSDFERLRDYTRDDNFRHIDWRSTARRQKLTVRQYQSDQSQRIIFMLDCGRMMTNERDGYSLLDHAFNSMLMMAYVALHQGDSVGLLCFSDTIHSFIPPRGGASQMNRLIQAGFDRFPRLVESRYDQAFLYLKSHCNRRSLVVLATNVIDEVNAATIVEHLAKINGQHLPLGVLLRDREMFDAVDAFDLEAYDGRIKQNEGNVATAEEKTVMYRAAAAADILLWRHQVITDLEHRGVLVVDAFPDQLTAPLVNQYLEIKAKHLL
jgi:uncharacterized protein (DUF58 family)